MSGEYRGPAPVLGPLDIDALAADLTQGSAALLLHGADGLGLRRAGREVTARVPGSLLIDLRAVPSAAEEAVSAIGRGERVVLLGRTERDLPDVLARRTEVPLATHRMLPLGLDDIARLAEGCVGGRVHLALAASVRRAASGNPALALHLLRYLQSHGDIVATGGVHRLAREPEGEVAAGAVAAALIRLPAPERHALEAVALSAPLPRSLASRITDSAAMDLLIDRGLVIAQTHPEAGGDLLLSVAHPLVAKTVPSLVGAETTAAIHRATLSSLDPHDLTPFGRIRAVDWALRAGELDIGEMALNSVARTAATLHQFDVAHRLWQRIRWTTSSVELLAWAHLGTAICERHLGHLNEARDHLQEALLLTDRCLPPHDTHIHTLATEERADLLHYVEGDLDGALDLLAHVPEGGPDGPRGPFISFVHLTYAGRTSEARRRLSASAAPPRRLEARARAAEAVGLTSSGHPETALDLLLGQGPPRHLSALALWGAEALEAARIFATQASRGPVAARAYLERMIAGNDAPLLLPDERLQLAGLAWAALAEGRPAVAKVYTDTAHLTTERGLVQGGAALSHAQSALAAAGLKDRGRARDHSRQASELLERGSGIFRADILANLLMVEATLGQPVAVSAHASAQSHLDQGNVRGALLLLDLALRSDEPEAVAAARTVHQLGGDLEGPLFALHLRHAEALISQDPAALASVSRGLEELELTVAALDTAVQAWRLAQDQHLSDLAAEVGDRIRLMATKVEMPGLVPMPADFATVTVRLTRREQEIAALLSAGLTNADIGARLHVTPRTVEGHVTRLYAKLGVTGRRRRDRGGPRPG